MTASNEQSHSNRRHASRDYHALADQRTTCAHLDALKESLASALAIAHRSMPSNAERDDVMADVTLRLHNVMSDIRHVSEAVSSLQRYIARQASRTDNEES
jgi:hypothetical protein